MLKRAKEKAERAAAEMAAKAQAAADAAMLAASGEPDHDPFDVAPADDDGEADGPAPGIAERLAVLTADDDSMPDQQIMAAMVQVASAGQPHEISELAQAVAERLASPSATVQNKLLRTTLQLCQRGTVEFRERLLHEAADSLHASSRFECPPHPTYGDKQQLLVRSTAQKVLQELGVEPPAEPEPELEPEPEPRAEPVAAAETDGVDAPARLITDGLPPSGATFTVAVEEVAGKELKLILLGDSGTGKSNLMLRLVEGRFEPKYTPTVGMDHKKHSLTSWNRTLRLQVWDMSGERTYGAILKAYYKKAACGVVVYDATDAQSFANVGKWVQELHDNTQEPSSPRRQAGGSIACILVATKCEGGSVVSSIDGQKAALQHGCSAFVETCSREGVGVVDAFQSAAFAAYESLLPDEAQRARDAVVGGGGEIAEENADEATADGGGDDDGDFMTVVCPDGMSPGSLIVVETPDGREVEAEIPEGKKTHLLRHL